MIEIKPPNRLPKSNKIKIFLAGSIEMGTAQKWQDRVAESLSDQDVVLLNPRRDDWDASWVEKIENPQFRKQVEWEIDALEASDYVIMYFDPNTKSPISLLETGLYARSGKLFIVCPDGFWRKGNIDILCKEYGVEQFNSLDELVEYIESHVLTYATKHQKAVLLDTLGWFGMVFILLAFVLLNTSVLAPNNLSYQLLNGFGAAGIAYEAYLKKDYQPAVLSILFLAVAIFGITRIVFGMI